MSLRHSERAAQPNLLGEPCGYTCPDPACEVHGHYDDEPGFCALCFSYLVLRPMEAA